MNPSRWTDERVPRLISTARPADEASPQGARGDGASANPASAAHPTRMDSSGNGDSSADPRVTRRGRDVGRLGASLEIAAPAPIERRGANELVRGNRPVSAIGYVSADDVARIDDPELKHQAAAIDDFCARRGWELVTLVRDVQPAKGRALDRPSLGYAIERLDRADNSALIVTELARLCRSVADLGEILDVLLQADACLVSLEPEIDTGTGFGRAAARVISAVSEWERARREERARKGLAAARAQGAVRPRIKPELKRRIVGMRTAGLTLQAIADELNDEGIPTARGGAKWRPSSVQSALGYKRPSRMRPRSAAGRRTLRGGSGRTAP
jgi:DNA invertase Pin-like site-specific DNA recombinase